MAGDFLMDNVSYCQEDRVSNDVVTFIAREHQNTKIHHCHVLQSNNQGKEIMYEMGKAFMAV